ncbi:hypothetical protein L207DRAFT_528547 [Hyaloscypha variabilis F]|uniref:Uncharacterized protein n=1 Tax=Hyaloscypha variabilis (strain UAMH 11265 / GT02V1 / F) TaxID=1149755 RepID=A0A2J6RNT0_HYAVF|nr:hypothetical protein L207DRAFT_528547 [Hyaloscypha variabilis F]
MPLEVVDDDEQARQPLRPAISSRANRKSDRVHMAEPPSPTRRSKSNRVNGQRPHEPSLSDDELSGSQAQLNPQKRPGRPPKIQNANGTMSRTGSRASASLRD